MNRLRYGGGAGCGASCRRDLLVAVFTGLRKSGLAYIYDGLRINGPRHMVVQAVIPDAGDPPHHCSFVGAWSTVLVLAVRGPAYWNPGIALGSEDEVFAHNDAIAVVDGRNCSFMAQ